MTGLSPGAHTLAASRSHSTDRGARKRSACQHCFCLKPYCTPPVNNKSMLDQMRCGKLEGQQKTPDRSRVSSLPLAQHHATLESLCFFYLLSLSRAKISTLLYASHASNKPLKRPPETSFCPRRSNLQLGGQRATINPLQHVGLLVKLIIGKRRVEVWMALD